MIALNLKYFKRELKAVKPLVFQAAAAFIQEKSRVVTRALTDEHHKIIHNFMEFKARSKNILK